MTTMAARSAVVDTNVLLAATVPSRRLHEPAMGVLEHWPNQGVRLLTTGQILREYIVVATRPAEVNGLDLTPEQALENVANFRQRMSLLTASEASVGMLLRIVREAGISGKAVHDANVVATMVSHGAESIVTANPGDFFRLAHYVRVVDLGDLDGDAQTPNRSARD